MQRDEVLWELSKWLGKRGKEAVRWTPSSAASCSSKTTSTMVNDCGRNTSKCRRLSRVASSSKLFDSALERAVREIRDGIQRGARITVRASGPRCCDQRAIGSGYEEPARRGRGEKVKNEGGDDDDNDEGDDDTVDLDGWSQTRTSSS